MPAQFNYIDITNQPELERVADQVQHSKQSVILKRGDEEVAKLSPVAPRSRRSRKAAPDNSWLLKMVDIGAGMAPADGATDVSENVDKYLTDAIYAESHPPTEQ